MYLLSLVTYSVTHPLYIIQETQDISLHELIRKSLELKQKYNAEYLKKIVSYNIILLVCNSMS